MGYISVLFTLLYFYFTSALAVTLSEKSSINTNRKSTTRFPMNGCFPSKIALRLKKGCYKVSLCEYC